MGMAPITSPPKIEPVLENRLSKVLEKSNSNLQKRCSLPPIQRMSLSASIKALSLRIPDQ
jgi:hypothetical protein